MIDLNQRPVGAVFTNRSPCGPPRTPSAAHYKRYRGTGRDHTFLRAAYARMRRARAAIHRALGDAGPAQFDYPLLYYLSKSSPSCAGITVRMPLVRVPLPDPDTNRVRVWGGIHVLFL